MSLVAALLALIFPALVILGATRDAVSYTIPNWISLALIAVFPPAALAAGLPLVDIGGHFAFGVAALLAGMVMFALRWVGGGDAKLLAAAALWIGWPHAVIFLGLTGAAGGALVFLLLGLRSIWLRPLVIVGPGWLARLGQPGEAVPYGVAIAVGALAVFPETPLGAAALGLVR